MALLPSATGRIEETGAGVAVGNDWIAILSPTPSGTAAVVRRTTKVQDTIDEFGRCEGAEAAAHLVELTGKPYLFCKVATATAGAVGPVNVEGVTGTSVITFTGTPNDEEHIKLVVVTGGTVGTAGIVIKVSRDGGRTYGGLIRLGTATSYAIPNTGVTANFAAGTLATNDTATAYCSAPMWDAAGLAAALDALKAHPIRPRLVLLCGQVSQASELQTVIDEIEAYETEAERHSVVLCALRDWYAPAAMQGNPTDVDFDAAADTITRNTGSWVTDGFKIGMTVTIAGSASNNGTHTVVNVTALVLTVSSTPGLVNELNVAGSGLTITAVESKAPWRSALEPIVGATPSTQKVSEKVVACGGRLARRSPIGSDKKRRPFSWALACRAMAYDIHISPAKVELGALPGWDMYDDAGLLVEHDERIDGGLLSMRIACARSFNERAGAYVALPLTLDTDNLPLSRLPITLVSQLVCTVARAAYEEKLNSEVLLNADGTITEAEARRIDNYVASQLQINQLASDGGQRWSSAVPRMDRSKDLRVQGQTVPWTVSLTALGYLEQFAGVVRVGG